jgi:hypothetical protein
MWPPEAAFFKSTICIPQCAIGRWWPGSSFPDVMALRRIVLFLLCAAASARGQSLLQLFSSQPVVRGSRAVILNGVAYAPSKAPDAVKRAIWAANSLRRKPYKWGGGHRSFADSGYDCSGTVSFALHYAGVLDSPIQSSELCNYGQRGRGRWITVYSRAGHAFAMIAGLRLDTTGNCGTEGPRWHADARDTWGYGARHPAGL